MLVIACVNFFIAMLDAKYDADHWTVLWFLLGVVWIGLYIGSEEENK